LVDTDPRTSTLIQRGQPLHYRQCPIPDHSGLMQIPLATTSNNSLLADLVVAEVASALVIDIHTHLLPPSHGSLCLWGIDELLTYVSMELTNTPTYLVRFIVLLIGKN
jgi:hypothetical protein